ncbi:hypothetical protein [Spiroplasma ixodetis]|uniref:hypothetical protein n=1 Tax=Spiroplasma ixodetis TaxID=2141 RepID=UPI00257856E2|nr:hypothetical protein [Spiroplasma ixodetis]WJG70986.1 hypothetical protein SIXOD_v1c22880 [Spiroplasma ixodetis Y32]
MINKLWTGVSLENYNNWYPLTGKITETPQQYIQTWPNVNDWFKTFAIRAQNDINAYLGFILSKFPFDSFKDELIKETLRDMVYVTAEHWVFNRTPIEFNVDATIQFNNGSQFSANSIPTINVWDLAPSRMKIWARLTELKQILSNYNDDEIDVEKIDLKAFYTRNQVDELIEQQKEFTLSKQIKLYDDLVDDNENEIYRGPVSKFINKGYVATDYDKETETMILDWPDEIGTLPPEALQNNPQIGDYTHAPTCDFSAKQQKQITTNENNITKLNDELTKTNENIDDIKNNWFNIVTSPLWKKMSSFIPSNEFGKIYLAIWGYIYQPPSTPTDNYIYSNKKTIFNLGGEIQRTTQKTIKLDELNVNDNVKIQLLFTKESNDITVVSNDINYQSSSIVLYQYIGKGRPTEFIAEEGTERDYYTKLETNNLLDKKQNKLTAGTNITIDENNKISATGGKVDLSDYYKKEEIDKKLKDKMDKDHFKYAFSINTIGTEIPNLETTDKTIAGAINELKEKIKDKKFSNDYFKYNTEANEIVLHDEENSLLCRDLLENNEYKLLKTQNKKLLQAINEILEKQPQPSPSGSNWKEVGTREKNKWDYWQITYDFQENKHYRVYYSWSIYNPVYTIQEFIITDKRIAGVPIQTFNDSANIVILSVQHAKWITIYTVKGNLKGNVWKLEELQE